MVNGTTTKFTLADGKITYQSDGTNSMYFRYNDDNTLIGFELNGTDYYYVKNLQGGIISILDNTGADVVDYTYDAWGKLLSTTGSLASTVGVLNPFRYRSYYYDTETGLYCLQSRYYDPVTSRMLNADDTSTLQATQGDLTETNLFVYGINNPVMNTDANGKGSIQFVGFGIQIELSLGPAVGGIEIVWYTSSQVNVNGRNRWNPYVYMYGGGGLGASANTRMALSQLIANPSKLFNPKSLLGGVSFSVCVFAIFGYSNFKSPNDYKGPFMGVYASAWNIKSYTSWSNTCFVVGIGWSTSWFSAGGSYTYYWLASEVFVGIGNLYNSTSAKATTINH